MTEPTVHLRSGVWTEVSSRDGTVHTYVRGRPMLNGVAVTFAELTDAPTAEQVATWTGQFAVIVLGADAVTLVTDHSRSMPLFFITEAGQTRVGDDLPSMLHGDATVDDRATRLFADVGFVVGRRTLFRGVQQVQAGEIVRVSVPQQDVSRAFFRRFIYLDDPITDAGELRERFDAALTAGMERMLAHADGRQLVVPLSGGLDSRLLVTYLRRVGYDNVLTFTYGRVGSSEPNVSRRVAELLHHPWHFVAYEPNEIRSGWASEEAARFIEFAHFGAGLPHVQDWYAVRQLRRDGVIADDAIMLPGHIVVGNITEPELLDEPGPVSPARVRASLLGFHYVQRGRQQRLEHDPQLIAELDAYLEGIGYDGSVRSRATAMECFMVGERQAKYINNSVRVYEFFGYEWALPLLDTELFDLWRSLDTGFTRDRVWYRGYVDDVFRDTVRDGVDYFAGSSIPKSRRDVIKRGLGLLGLESAAQRALSTRIIMSHPMAFNYFTGPVGQAELLRRLLRGQQLLGIYAELFLKDAWNPHTHVFG